MSQATIIHHLAEYISASESTHCRRILALLRDGGELHQRDIIEQLRHGRAHGPHHARLAKELHRMRVTGLLNFEREGHSFVHRITDLGRAVDAALTDSVVIAA